MLPCLTHRSVVAHAAAEPGILRFASVAQSLSHVKPSPQTTPFSRTSLVKPLVYWDFMIKRLARQPSGTSLRGKGTISDDGEGWGRFAIGLNKLNALEPAEPVRRYERENPGDLIHIDIKKLGRIGSVGVPVENSNAAVSVM